MTDDPLELPRWTLAQTLAWIIHRTPEAVLETLMNMAVLDVADKAAILTFDKDRDDQERARPADDLRPGDKFRPDKFRRDELRDHLMDGTLTAYGISEGQFKHSAISKIDWDTIDSFYVYYNKSQIGPRDVGSSNECSPRYRDVFVLPSDVLRLWPDPLAKPANKGGRPSVVDWPLVKEEAFRLMDDNAEFGPDLREWNAQARLEEALEDYCETTFGKRPGRSTLQGRVAPWLLDWRNSKTRRPGT